ncbi:MAG: NAD(P)/FAD-dependent oxidoreductase [Deltaproteobacteria bacterium]|nr:NAD(P)/FAD-dependent oxidoreductase [Deltaproteobacteria bacterium]
MTCLIVGGGAAGFQAAATCRALRPDQTVTLIDAEMDIGYYRTLLPQFMVGALPEEKLFFPHSGNDPLLTVRTGVRVKSLDRSGRCLLLDSGEALCYDRLILAHGGESYLPGILAGPPCRGIFPVRDLTTARKTKAWISDHRKVVVFGGSLVGVKTAVHLSQAGFEVSLVVRRGHILLRALSPEAAEVVEAHLRNLGIKVRVNAALEDLRIRDGGIDALKAGGRWLPCSTLLVAAGVSPDTSFLEGTGLLTDGELVVSPALQTIDPRIFAAGDVAVIASRGEKISPNTWPQAVSQGKLAAENLYRSSPAPHRDWSRINAMELHGIAMVVLGPPVVGAEVISHARPEASVRRELFLIDGRPVGGALIGDISAAGTLHALINAGRPLTARDAGLLRPQTGNVIRFPEQTGRREALILSPKRSSL